MSTPCLILLDWMMPVMDGEQFLRAREKKTAAAESPVVVVSAVPQWAKQADGVAGLLGKPVDLDRLLGAVRAHCKRPPGAAAVG